MSMPAGPSTIALSEVRCRASLRVDGASCTGPNGLLMSWTRLASVSSDALPISLVDVDIVYDALGRDKERAVRLPKACWIDRQVHDSDAARGIDRGVQCVRVGIREVRIDAPSSAHDIVPVATHVVRKAKARLNIVLVRAGGLS